MKEGEEEEVGLMCNLKSAELRQSVRQTDLLIAATAFECWSFIISPGGGGQQQQHSFSVHNSSRVGKCCVEEVKDP